MVYAILKSSDYFLFRLTNANIFFLFLGILTGSVYKDYGLLKSGFPAESVSNSSVSFQTNL